MSPAEMSSMSRSSTGESPLIWSAKLMQWYQAGKHTIEIGIMKSQNNTNLNLSH